MGKGFNNFMSKKDFHPSAFWNLKKVWEAQQKKDLDQKRQDEMRAQYEKEQEILNNKALLGDEKAKMGLSFMYDAPAGINKREREEANPELEPKFEWQRKFNAPREEWAKGNEDIRDQPFGIQVRNVRCVKCHTWGHLNTDNECPLFNMSGNHEAPGFSTNPSDLIKELREEKEKSSVMDEKKKERMDLKELDAGMKEEYGIALKGHVMDIVNADQAIEEMGTTATTSSDDKSENQAMFQFLQGLSEKERTKIFNKFFASTSGKKKHKEKSKKKKRKSKKSAAKDSSDSEEEDRNERKRKRHKDEEKNVDKYDRSKKIKKEPEESDWYKDDRRRSIKKEPISPLPTPRNNRTMKRSPPTPSTRRSSRSPHHSSHRRKSENKRQHSHRH